MLTEHVIFDLDGTLTDPREGITRSYAHALEVLGYPVPPLAELTRFIGPPTREVVGELLGTADSELIERAVTIYRERFGRVGLYENEVYAGMNQLLAQLAARGHSLWICTSKPSVYAQPIAQHFGFTRSLRAVYGCELDGTRADKAELLAYLLEHEAIAPERAVMIGDRMHDIRAARVCGIRSIGVLYGFGSRQELSDAGADWLCDAVSDLAALIAQLG
jgi:phosphoglycolate phosphatase